LSEIVPRHEFFVAIDSDGCAFDAMELKHKECFIPNIIKWWELQAVSKYVREAAEFVNLYSQSRGSNRFPALVEVFDLLKERPEVQERNVAIPEAGPLRAWIARETRLGNPALRKEVERTGDPVLRQALQWSEAVNAAVEDMVHGVPPFPFVRESIEKISPWADIIVCSATPTAALEREWEEHGLAPYVRAIAGQEMGKKAEHIRMAAGGKYRPDRILMIGDAPGDFKAARANAALFYPIMPGSESRSWRRFHDEAADRFRRETYRGPYEDELTAAFHAALPATPPWRAS
jgi:phosphoglycolate phosphatase-like HAD superfamily hydrolase